ncbi:TPA: hypothetical protein DCX16_03020 [bacterium]|nr:hypothetical protein [bacterium]
MISPSIFIGLGSTGMDILEHLQMLILEEYGISSLPIFKYLAIETNQSHIPKTPPFIKSDIEVIYPIITSTLSIKEELKDGKKQYLTEWLDEAVLDIPGNAFTLGASNIRQAGRLCLWENWGLVTDVLNNAKAKITNTVNLRNTIEILREYYRKIGKKVSLSEDVIGTTPNIYIFGSLCGGTASGMFVDIAYYLRYLFGLWAVNYQNRLATNIQGIFTILDEKLLSRVGFSDIDKWSANCFASLIELDYFSHPQSTYEVLFPNNIKIKSNDTPFDYTYLVSTSGQGGTFWKEDGTIPDLESLNHMISLFLFTEAVSSLYSRKEEIRTDFRGFVNATVPNENEHLPFLASFGISCIWYPKYRISRAVSCRLASDLCKKWQGEHSLLDQTSIKYDAEKLWKEILEKGITLLTKKPGGSIESEIREVFDKEMVNLNRPISDIVDNIGIKKIMEMLKEDNDFDEVIKNQLAIFKRNTTDDIKHYLHTRINKHQNLSEAQSFISFLEGEIEKTMSNLPLRYPAITPAILDGLHKVKLNIFERLSPRNKIIKEKKKKEALNGIYNHLIAILKQVRGYRAKPILDRIREFLRTDISKEVDDMMKKLSDCIDKLEEQGEDEIKRITKKQSIEIIANNLRNDIEEDVDALKGEITSLSSHKWRILLNAIFTKEGLKKIELYEFLHFLPDEIVLRMTEPFMRGALESIKKFNIADDIQKKLDRATLLLLAKRALPYLSLTGEFTGLQRPPSFICGSDEEGGSNLTSLENLLSDSSYKNRIQFGKSIITDELDHLLIFYTEQGLLYIDENLKTFDLYQIKYKDVVMNSPYEVHTVRGGKQHFDVIMEKRRREVKRLLKIAIELIPSKVFEKVKDDWVFRYVDSVGIHTSFLPEKQPIDAIIADEHGFLLFQEKILSAIKEDGIDGLRKKINEHIKKTEKDFDGEKAKDEAEYYKNVILEFFPKE